LLTCLYAKETHAYRLPAASGVYYGSMIQYFMAMGVLVLLVVRGARLQQQRRLKVASV
jgi:hypothetical protein